MKIELKITIYLTTSYTTNSDSASTKILHRWLPESSDEVLRARTAQALRAFLCLSLSEGNQLNPEKLMQLSRLGKGLVVPSIAISVYEIYTAENKVSESGR